MPRAAYTDPWIQLLLAEIKLAQGDPVAAQSLLEQVPLDFSPAGTFGAPDSWQPFTCAITTRQIG